MDVLSVGTITSLAVSPIGSSNSRLSYVLGVTSYLGGLTQASIVSSVSAEEPLNTGPNYLETIPETWQVR